MGEGGGMGVLYAIREKNLYLASQGILVMAIEFVCHADFASVYSENSADW